MQAELKAERAATLKASAQQLADVRAQGEHPAGRIEAASERHAAKWELVPRDHRDHYAQWMERHAETVIYAEARTRWGGAAPSVRLQAYEDAIARGDDVTARFLEEDTTGYQPREAPTTSEIIALYTFMQRKREEARRRHPAAVRAFREYLKGLPIAKVAEAEKLRLVANTAMPAA